VTTIAAAPPDRVPRQVWTLVLASLGLFMAALDTLVVATALPSLRTGLGANLSDLEWTVNGYNLAFACLLLTGAALGDRFGRKRMYSIGLLVFAAGSVAAAVSTNVETLITARVVQGAGASIVMPITLTLISEAFPAGKRGMAIGMWGGIAGTAVAAGPVVGGAVIEGISWQWIFWFNVPVGLLLIPLATARLTESFGSRSRLDITGLVLAGAGLFSVTWGLVRASSVGWGSGEVIGTLVLGVVLIAAFMAWEQRAQSPMLRLVLFRSRSFSAANGVSFFMYAALFGATFLMTQFLQNGLGYSPLQAGLRILPWTAGPLVFSPIAGILADRFGNRIFMAAGMALQAAGLGWVAAIAKPGMGYGELAIALTVAGIGIALVFPTVANEVVGAVPPGEMGVASGTNSALREVGGVFGISILATVFSSAGVYLSPKVFVDHFTNALWVGAAFSAVGIAAAVFASGRRLTAAQVVEPAAVAEAVVGEA
jgi:EmrB/QacA subfamily drug resistance transporter